MAFKKRASKAGGAQETSASRNERFQRGATKTSGYKLERRDGSETLYFRTAVDRDLAAKADSLAYELRRAQ